MGNICLIISILQSNDNSIDVQRRARGLQEGRDHTCDPIPQSELDISLSSVWVVTVTGCHTRMWLQADLSASERLRVEAAGGH